MLTTPNGDETGGEGDERQRCEILRGVLISQVVKALFAAFSGRCIDNLKATDLEKSQYRLLKYLGELPSPKVPTLATQLTENMKCLQSE